MYESIKRVSGLGQQQQQPPVYLSLTQTITAPSSSDQLVLPVCLGPGEVSRALEGGINTAFKGQLSQNASVDTTYVQVTGVLRAWGPGPLCTGVLDLL